MTQDRHDLDPEDWEAFRREAHTALDGAIDYIRDARERPVWRPAPAEAKRFFHRPLPQEGRPLSGALADFERYIKPYVTGNTHPLFMGWVHGAGTPVGMVAEMLAASLNANCGGRNQIAVDVERQIALWMAEAFGFPPESSGIFVTGASMANFLSIIVARDQVLGDEKARESGLLASGRRLTAYTSTETHNCVKRAMELAGLGAENLRRIPTDAGHAIRIDALERAIAEDRMAGFTPFMIVGSAGTVNVGAIDPLDRLADVAEQEKLWFHIDGAFGALASLSPRLKPLLNGLERADSVAFDFHKWLQTPYDAGFFLVRDPIAHKNAFVANLAYLARAPRGLAAGETWPCDLGADLSRGFRALKTWFTLEVFGAKRLGESIWRTCEMARYLQSRLERSTLFAVRAPVTLNIVCFALRDDPQGRLSGEIVMNLQESGRAAPSTTIIDDVLCIRAAIFNHRTQKADIDAFIENLELEGVRALSQARIGEDSASQA